MLIFSGGLQTKVAPHLAQPNEAIECINIDLDKGSIYPYNEWVLDELVTATGTKPYFFKDALITNSDIADDRSYAIFGNRLYWSNGTFSAYGLLRWNGTTAVNAVAPTVSAYGALTLTPSGTNGALNDTYAYAYTVVDSEGIESIPSPITNVSPVNQNVNITIGTDTVSETVAKRRIYRTGGSNPTFNLIAELVDPIVTYSDTTRDLDVSRVELSTFDNYAPPADLTNLIESAGVMWGSVGDRVYFSREGQPEFWNPLDFVALSDACTGIGRFQDLVVAFTESNTYVISGYNRDTISLNKLPYNEGCINNHSIANVTELLMWTSKNGVCIFNGSTIEIVTRNILSWNKDSVVGSATFDSFVGTFDADIGYKVEYAIGLRGKYYAVYQDGIGVIDLNNGALASTISLTDVRSLYYNNTENVMCAITTDLSVYGFNKGGSPMLAQWKTPKLQDEGYASLKQFRRVTLDSVPELVVVYVNDKQVLSIAKKRDFFLPSGAIGNTIQFQISTLNEIRSLKYEYGVTNG